MAAIDFLTRTGQICDEKRQEFILLSDVLGVSMLVDAVNHRKPSGATESTVLGPFHVPDAPALPMGANISKDPGGEPVLVRGTIRDTDGRPIDAATLDVWQTSADGFYDVQDERQTPMNLRGLFRTTENGRFWFRTIKPASYPIPTDGPVGELLAAMGRSEMRPAHIHFIVGGSRPRERDDTSLCRGRPLSRVRRRLRRERNAHCPLHEVRRPRPGRRISKSAIRSISWNGTSYSRARAAHARPFGARHDLSTGQARIVASTIQP